jgi:hypothetical protein
MKTLHHGGDGESNFAKELEGLIAPLEYSAAFVINKFNLLL